jgi:hypothetical protein
MPLETSRHLQLMLPAARLRPSPAVPLRPVQIRTRLLYPRGDSPIVSGALTTSGPLGFTRITAGAATRTLRSRQSTSSTRSPAQTTPCRRPLSSALPCSASGCRAKTSGCFVENCGPSANDWFWPGADAPQQATCRLRAGTLMCFPLLISEPGAAFQHNNTSEGRFDDSLLCITLRITK